MSDVRPHLQNLNIFDCDRIEIAVQQLTDSVQLQLTIDGHYAHINFWSTDRHKTPLLIIDREVQWSYPGDDALQGALTTMVQAAADIQVEKIARKYGNPDENEALDA